MRYSVSLAACVLLCGMFHGSMSVEAQHIQRSAVLPTGGSSVIGAAHVAWSAGQVATMRLGSAAVNITQGFQQPYFSAADIRTESFSGKPGEIGRTAIVFSNPLLLFANTAQELQVKLRFNATLLQPINSSSATTVLADTIIDGSRTMTLRVPFTASGAAAQVLSTLDFRIGLGNEAASPLELVEAVPVGGSPMLLRRSSGEFTLLGVCLEGGIRLVDPIDRTRLLLKPNPVRDNGTLEFEVLQPGAVQASIIDLFGHILTTVINEDLKPGKYTVTFSTIGLPAGAHTIVLKTSTTVVSHPIVIQH